MQTSDATDAFWGAAKPTPDFHIALLYDTAANGRRAMKICQRVIENFNSEFLFHIAACDIESFANPEPWTAAVRQASRANLVVVASSSAMPPSLINWLKHWGEEMTGEPAGIAAITESAPALADTVSALQQICHDYRLDFIRPETETLTTGFANAGEKGGPTHETYLSAPTPPEAGVETKPPIYAKNGAACGDKGGSSCG